MTSTCSLARFFLRREFLAANELCVRRPLHHGSLAARAPVVPLPRFAGAEVRALRSRDASWRPSFRRAIGNGARASKMLSRQSRNRSGPRKGQGWGLLFVRPLSVSPDQTSRNKMKEAERRQTLVLNLRILRCGSRPFGARSLVGVPPRLSSREYFIPKVSFRPGFLGRGLHGRYPPSPVPVQGCTSHPGRNAGRHDAQAAREQAANPPAGTALAPMTRCASAPYPSPERGL